MRRIEGGGVMARQVKPEQEHHTFKMVDDRDRGQVTIVQGNGRLCYLWIAPKEGHSVLTFSGRNTLRKFAKQILKQVGER